MSRGAGGLVIALSLCGLIAVAFAAVQAPAVVELPVERASNVFFARATINGRGPFWFTVDTGATLTVIDPATAATAGLRVTSAGMRANVGVGEKDTELSTAAGATIASPGLPAFTPAPLYVVPVRSTAGWLGHTIDGVLGTDFLQRYIVEFDYGASRVTLHRPRRVTAPPLSPGLPITVDGNVLLAPATLALEDWTTVTARLLIDTGSNGSLTLTSPFVRAHKLADRFQSRRASAAIGINGATFSPVVQLVSLAFGTTLMRTPDAALSRAASGLHASAAFDGILGAELLRRYRMVVDYPRRRLWLHPLPEESSVSRRE